MFPPLPPNVPPSSPQQPPVPQPGQAGQPQVPQGAPPPYEEDPAQAAARSQYSMVYTYAPYPYPAQVCTIFQALLVISRPDLASIIAYVTCPRRSPAHGIRAISLRATHALPSSGQHSS